MTTFKTLLIASAVSIAGLAAVPANAATYVSTDSDVMVHTSAPAPAHMNAGPTVASESTIAVGTRKVGHVGGRPYPIEAAQMENTTVQATPDGLVQRTEVTTSGTGVINVNNSGGDYYTETDGSYYADPAFNVNVYTTGSFND